MERVDSESAEYYRQAQEGLDRGYELNYDSIGRHISEETMSGEQCKEIMDILDMFCALERSYDELKEKPSIDERGLRFQGFDLNHETAQLAYTRFLIDEEGGYAMLANHGDKLNSHAPLLVFFHG